MQIELRNVKHAAFASQETNCFEATIYVNGVRAGTARNDGKGGATFIEPLDLDEKIEVYAKTLPLIDMAGGFGTMSNSAELLIDQLLTDSLRSKDLKKAMGKRVVFLRDGKVFEYGPLKPDDMIALLGDPARLAELNAEQVLNLLPFAEALVIYCQYAKRA